MPSKSLWNAMKQLKAEEDCWCADGENEEDWAVGIEECLVVRKWRCFEV